MRRILPLVFAALLFAVPALALNPIRVGAESVENYSGCGCNSGNLSYCNDQSSMFLNRIDDWHTRVYLYHDSSAWNADVVEDQIGVGGQDRFYGDNVHLLLISGHGNQDSSQYYGFLCKNSTFNMCNYGSNQMTLGEQPGQANSTNPGMLRFLILCTCFSVDKTLAPAIWRPVFARVAYRDAHFRCEQQVTAYATVRGTAIGILVEPENMHPVSVAKCDCLYDITFEIPALAPATYDVTVERRWDARHGEREPVRIGTARVTVQ